MSIADRVRGMISRAVINLVNDEAKLQSLNITLMAGQTTDDVEHFQHYGLTGVPHKGAEGIGFRIGGSAGHTVVLCVDDRRYRLTGLLAGEVALYDDLGHKVHLTRAGIVIDGGGHQLKMVNLAKLRVEADIDATGQIRDMCDSPVARTMQEMRADHSGHRHQEHDAGGLTDPPAA